MIIAEVSEDHARFYITLCGKDMYKCIIHVLAVMRPNSIALNSLRGESPSLLLKKLSQYYTLTTTTWHLPYDLPMPAPPPMIRGPLISSLSLSFFLSYR